MDIKVLDLKGKEKKAKDVKFLDVPAVSNADHVLYLVETYQRNMLQQGTASVKTRSTIRGGGAKPYRQKGTGNARRGTNRTPLRRGGSVIFGPQTRDFSTNLNNKTIRSGIRQAFNVVKDRIKLIDNDSEAVLKTKEALALFGEQASSGKVVVVLSTKDQNLKKACRNIANCDIFSPSFVRVAPLCRADLVLVSTEAIEELEGRLS